VTICMWNANLLLQQCEILSKNLNFTSTIGWSSGCQNDILTRSFQWKKLHETILELGVNIKFVSFFGNFHGFKQTPCAYYEHIDSYLYQVGFQGISEDCNVYVGNFDWFIIIV
jgi:hypothetical protein